MRAHWLFWPMITLLFFVATYAIVFSNNGLIAYDTLKKKKERLEVQVQKLEERKKEAQKSLGLLKDDRIALEKFTRELLMYEDKVHILKFQESQNDVANVSSSRDILKVWQTWSIVGMSLIVLLVTFIAWFYENRQKIPEKTQEPLSL